MVSRETLRAEAANLFHVKHRIKVASSKLPRIVADTESASLSILDYDNTSGLGCITEAQDFLTDLGDFAAKRLNCAACLVCFCFSG